jgi:hypothetical protein
MRSNTQHEDNPGCLGQILTLFGIKPAGRKPKAQEAAAQALETYKAKAEKDVAPYRLRDDFLSPAEHSFYQVIRPMMGDYFAICPKVNLGDLVFVVNLKDNFAARNRINRKHIDFLVCERKTMQPKFAIELDDSSHSRRNRAERDDFVDEVFAQAGLPLVRVKAGLSYNQQELGAIFKSAVQPALSVDSGSTSRLKSLAQEKKAEDATPLCPKCGVPMVLREASRGSRRGERFYGCVNFPKCREVIPLGSAS